MTIYDPRLDGWTAEQIRIWAAAGIYPPPYAGDRDDPEIISLLLTAHERQWEVPSLAGTDDEGVDRQMSNFRETVQEGLAMLEPADPQERGAYHRPHGSTNC